jgi:hypothetical protein
MSLQFEPERSGVDRRRGDGNGGHCDMHVENSTKLNNNAEKLSGLSSSYTTLKWFVGVCMPVIILMMSFFWNMASDNSKVAAERSKEISSDVKEIKAIVQTQLIDNARVNSRIDNIEKDVKELTVREEKEHRIRK